MTAALLVASLLALTGGASSQDFLSNLRATKHSPLFTTYAAAMQRSEFILDEGYHFLFRDSVRGIEFTTDNAGDHFIAFRLGGRFISRLAEMYREPLISVSYPDLVRYDYEPFARVRVDASFFVYSSRVAIHDVTITNRRAEPITLDLFSLLQNRHRTFDSVTRIASRHTIAFLHEEHPDSWTIANRVPYVDRVRNVFVLSERADRLGAYSRFDRESTAIPQRFDMHRKQFFVAWGRIVHASGERCAHDVSKIKFQVTRLRDNRTLLTENAPRYGSTESNVTQYALYGFEAGNFPDAKPGDSLRLLISCGETGASGSLVIAIADTSREKQHRHDVRLSSKSFMHSTHASIEIGSSRAANRITWKPVPGASSYRVYRRAYASSGVYELICDAITSNECEDARQRNEGIVGYVVVAVDSLGREGIHSDEVNTIAPSDFLSDVNRPSNEPHLASEFARVVSAEKRIDLAPKESKHLRIVRVVGRTSEPVDSLLARAEAAMKLDLDRYQRENEELFRRAPVIGGEDETQMLYRSAFNLMRQQMLPPEGKCGFNSYVFSREPQWGWGHGGQVFHESLSMLAYAYLDPIGAMNSQRVYRERQHADGYINYRTGPYLDESIPTNGQLTTSAPWYAWTNWEIFRITNDTAFLREMYESSARFYRYVTAHRDSDSDGLCEWGADAVLESVRDARVAVWDEVGDPTNFEALDLNCMLVREADALASMAAALGLTREAAEWGNDARARTQKINSTFWDEATGFYYHADKTDHDFSFKKEIDLKRKEIIGFLPLWAGVADSLRAARLVAMLTDTSHFWRRYGVPSLAASDSYYNPKGYWNGPVWVEWNYLIVNGLLRYGYKAEAREIVRRVAENMIAQLKRDHTFWEFYSPDHQWGGYHQTYIWAGIIARMLLEIEE